MRIGRYINEVCELFNMSVVMSVTGDADTMKVSVAIGDDPDLYAAGEIVTRWFPSEEALDEFCELNINRFRIAAQQQMVPNATEWR